MKSASAGDSAEQNGPGEKKTAENENEEEKFDDKHESPTYKVVEKEHKSSVSTYKDEMNVVLHEDLKDVFKKFGTVKVLLKLVSLTI